MFGETDVNKNLREKFMTKIENRDSDIEALQKQPQNPKTPKPRHKKL